jgi:O-acetyl-ADP-ribose deacetylase
MILIGDISKQDTECIVNCSNKELAWEDLTVNGVIQCAAGINLTNELKRIHNTIGDLKTGDAVITDGYNLKCKKIIHTLGPVYPCNKDAKSELKLTYINCYSLANNYKIRSISFPAISTGVFRFPIELATEICYEVYLKWKKSFDEIRFVCYNNNDKNVYDECFLKEKV